MLLLLLVLQCEIAMLCPPHQSNIVTALYHRYTGHEPAEVNFWVPVVDVYGSNTLHTESQPGKGDYRPMRLSVRTGNHESCGCFALVAQCQYCMASSHLLKEISAVVK